MCRILPKVRVGDVAKISRHIPEVEIVIGFRTLQPHFVVELIRLLDRARYIRARTAVGVFFANGSVDEVLYAEAAVASWFGHGHGHGLWGCLALIHVACAVLVVVLFDLEERDGSAVVEAGQVGWGVQVLPGNVAVVCGLEPVSTHACLLAVAL